MSVTIRRCVLRIRRHGGWSWGPDPEALLGAATRALPRLIAQHVRERTPPPAAGAQHHVAPVRLHVATTLEELAALAAAAYTGEDPSAIAPRMSEQLAAEVARALAAIEPADRATATTAAASATALAMPDEPPRGPEATLALLGRWAREQVILEVLRSAPPALVVAWVAAVRSVLPGAAEADAATEARARELAVSLARRLASEHAREVIAAAVIGAAAAAGDPRSDLRFVAAALAFAEQVTGGGDPAGPASAARTARVTGSATGADRERTATVEDGTVRRAAGPAVGEERAARAAPGVANALPFLAMVPLARCGWLDAARAILDGADAMALAPALGAAIAYKLAPPPELGWLRRPEHRAAAATLAGRDLADAELDAARAPLAPLANVLIAPLTAELRRGHRRGAPLLLARDGDDHALVDTEGTFLLASAPDLGAALDAARGLGDVVLVPAALASARVLDGIECANLVFVTDAPPERGQPWRAVPGARLWTNDGGAIDRHAALAAQLVDAADLAGEVLGALHARPALPRIAGCVLDRIATHAAALALGDIAWNLFRTRETPSPILALERFATLDAAIAVDDERVEVRVPLGRRHADLLAHGYLTAVPGVPWLHGRVLHIMGG